MSRYVLGLRKRGAQTDEAVPCRTAQSAVELSDAWLGEGGSVKVILRADKPIHATVPRRDAECEGRDEPK